MSSIRFELVTGSVDKITNIPGKTNLADVLTKPDSPLTEALLMTLFTGKHSLDFHDVAISKSSMRNFRHDKDVILSMTTVGS